MEATWGVLEKDKVQALAAEKQGVGGGTDLRERQGQKHNKSQEHSSRTDTPELILNQILKQKMLRVSLGSHGVTIPKAKTYLQGLSLSLGSLILH